ncbi:MerR family transcriptional regulator [Streptomyces sp. NPDC058420]|uniref:MerR family transcriptional regulator n=1 Tax=Streptomyces sp. NPDC058420 TaxID=3346489 RepID=UPI0036466B6D
MRIGELAATVGVTTRTVRHYHHLGLLPEPERLGNGYRDYGLRHAVVLARIRRLTELGLGLPEVRDVLTDDAGRDLVEVLTELDEDLARQESAVRERRARLRTLLDAGELTGEAPHSPELTALFAELTQVSAPAPESPMAAKDREMLALLDTVAAPEERARIMDVMGSALATPDAVARAHEAYALLDALADPEHPVDPADPRVDAAARALAACIPAALLAEAEPVDHDNGFLRAFYADFAPAQAAAIRRALRIATRGRP